MVLLFQIGFYKCHYYIFIYHYTIIPLNLSKLWFLFNQSKRLIAENSNIQNYLNSEKNFFKKVVSNRHESENCVIQLGRREESGKKKFFNATVLSYMRRYTFYVATLKLPQVSRGIFFLTFYTNICSNTWLDITPRKYVEVEFGGIMNTVLIKWSKTLLYSYPHITKFVKALEEELSSVTSLGYGSRHFAYGQSTYDFLESMLDLGKRIRNLKEIKETIGEVLGKIGESGSILTERYVKRRCIEEIITGVSPRTMYRRFDKAVGEFSFELLRQGYTPEVLDEMFGNERFIIAVKNRMRDGSRPIYAHRDGKQDNKKENSCIISESSYADEKSFNGQADDGLMGIENKFEISENNFGKMNENLIPERIDTERRYCVPIEISVTHSKQAVV